MEVPSATPVRLLLCGFEPFAHYRINPSGEAAEAIGRELAPRVIGARLTVDYAVARARLLELIDQHRPQACLCTGLASGDEFRIERCARKVPQFAHLSGSLAHTAGDGCDNLCRTLTRLGVSWRFSDDCGMYVCESTYWALLEHAATTGMPGRCAFLHVPAIGSAWPLERLVDVLREVVLDWL